MGKGEKWWSLGKILPEDEEHNRNGSKRCVLSLMLLLLVCENQGLFTPRRCIGHYQHFKVV